MSLIKNFRKMVTGSALAQLVTLASLPLISFLYEPSSLGSLASFMALVSIIGMISSMRLERGLFRLGDESERQELLCLAVNISIITSLIFTVFVSITTTLTHITISFTDFIPLYFTSLSVSLIQVYSVYLSAEGNFQKVAKSVIFRCVILVCGQCAFFYIFEQKMALILSATTAAIMTLAYLLKGIAVKVNLSLVKGFIRKRQNMYNMTSGFIQATISTVNNNANVLLVSFFLGATSAGVFMVAEKLIRAPINLISNNLRPVFAKHYQEKKNVNNAFKYSLILALISIPLLVIAYFTVDLFINTLFTDEYLGAIPVIKLLLFWIFLNFIQLPFQSYNLHFLSVHYLTLIEMVSFIVKVISFLFIYKLDQGVITVCYAMLISSFVSFCLNFIVFTFAKYRAL